MALSDSTQSVAARRRGQGESLGEAIAAVTRGIHARLNKSIIARLPLALPPRASDPSYYVTGLLHITPIYTTFEGLWSDFLEPYCDGVDPHAELVATVPTGSETPPAEPSPLSTPVPQPQKQRQRLPVRVHSVLHALHLPGLVRGEHLKVDIQSLTGWSSHVLEDQLNVASQSPHLASMIEHVEKSIREKPLLLVTYTYIMYMALFAGGRFIRATLESTGDEFWQTPLSPIRPTMQPCVPKPDPQDDNVEPRPHSEMHKCHHPLPLSFFHFNTPHDGEDLKVEFKRRLRICEAALEPQERDDIIHEAANVFQHITSLVHELDNMCDEDTTEDAASAPGHFLQVMPLLSRLRDSMAVAKERHARGSPRASSSEGDSAGTVIRRRTCRSSASSESRTSASLASEHPPMPSLTGVELCPAAAVRSVRFNSALAIPQQNEEKKWAARHPQLKTAGYTSCVLVVLLGLVTVLVFLAP